MDMRRVRRDISLRQWTAGLPARVAPPTPRAGGHHDERPPALLGLTTADAEGRSQRSLLGVRGPDPRHGPRVRPLRPMLPCLLGAHGTRPRALLARGVPR